jgi:hypothetical protein
MITTFIFPSDFIPLLHRLTFFINRRAKCKKHFPWFDQFQNR